MTTLAMISGSLRAGSLNSALIRAAAEAVRRAGVGHVHLVAIGGLPLYDGDVEAAGDPPAVAAAKARLAGCDALLIATPEYNGQPPGVLKNALDWFSRPSGAAPLTGLPVTTVSASPGQYGALWSQQRLRELLTACGAEVVEHELLTVPYADRLLDERGELADAATRYELTALVERLALAARGRRLTVADAPSA